MLKGLLIALGVILYLRLNWKTLVKFVLILVILEGVVRKWILPSYSEIVYFLKDILLIGAYFKFFILTKNRSQLIVNFKTGNFLIVILFVWSVINIFNPDLGSWPVGILGLKAYFVYIPLVWMVPALFETKKALLVFLRRYSLLIIPVVVLAFVQFKAPANSALNIYASGGQANAVFGLQGFVRVTGTFSFISGYVTYLTFCFALILPLVLHKQPGKWSWILLIELALIGSGMFLSGSRKAVLGIFLMFSIFVFISTFDEKIGLSKLAKKLFVPLLIAVVATAQQAFSAAEAFMFRLNEGFEGAQGQDFLGRMFEPFDYLTKFLFHDFFGWGTGAAHQGATPLRMRFDLPAGVPIPPSEHEYHRVLIELGSLGLILYFALRMGLIFYLWQVYKKVKDVELRPLALSIFVFHVSYLLHGYIVYNHTLSIFFWFFVGLSFLLPKIEEPQ